MPRIEGEGFPKQSLGCGGVLTYSPNKGGATEVGFLLIPQTKGGTTEGGFLLISPNKRSLRSEWGSYLLSIELPLYIRICRRRLGT